MIDLFNRVSGYPGAAQTEIVAAPRGGPLAFLAHLLARRRESKDGQPAILLPADYRVEIRGKQVFAA